MNIIAKKLNLKYKLKGTYLFDPKTHLNINPNTQEIAKNNIYHNDGTDERLYPLTLIFLIKEISKLKTITTEEINKKLQEINLLPLKYEYAFNKANASIMNITGIIYENQETNERIFGKNIIT